MKRVFITIVVCFVCASAQAYEAVVDANKNCVSGIYYDPFSTPSYQAKPLNTNIFVSPGSDIEIIATGTWGNASYLTWGPGGNPYEDVALGYPGAGLPIGSLLAKIGETGDYFVVGEYFRNTANEEGFLYLGFNDTDYGNNWGQMSVEIIIAAPIIVVRSTNCDCEALREEIEILRNGLEDIYLLINTPPGKRERLNIFSSDEQIQAIIDNLLPPYSYGLKK